MSKESKARKFFFKKYGVDGLVGETQFQDAVRLLLRRRGVRLFNLENLTEEQEAILLQEFQSLTKDGLKELLGGKDATVNVFNVELR